MKKFCIITANVYKPTSKYCSQLPYSETEKAIGISYYTTNGWIYRIDSTKILWIAKSLINIESEDVNEDFYTLRIKIPFWILRKNGVKPNQIVSNVVDIIYE